jgi:hypothetical protein
MIKSGLAPRPSTIGAKIQSFARWKWFFSLAIAVLVTVAATPESNQNPDEQYIQIMALVDKADALRKAGQADAAKAKYIQAEKALLYFKAVNPLYSPRAVAYRLKEVSDYADARPAFPEPKPMTSEAKPKTNLESPAAAKGAVKLLEPGAEPRSQLRYHPKAGDKQTMIATLKMKSETPTPAGAPAGGDSAGATSSMTIQIDFTVQDVAANGDVNYEAVVGDIAVVDAPGTPPETAEREKTLFASLKGLTVLGIASDRGINKKNEIKASPMNNPQLASFLNQIKELTANLNACLPEEAVGNGAKWERAQPMKAQGMTIQETDGYELVSAEGDKLNFKSSLTQSAANQKIQSPAAGMVLTLVQLTGTGNGTLTTDLSKLVPITGTIDAHTESTMEIGKGDQKKTISTKEDINATLESH